MNMFAHFGHDHGSETVAGHDDCMTIIWVAGVIITVLVAMIVYLLMNRQSKSSPTPKPKSE